jgi:hypothetical protein
MSIVSVPVPRFTQRPLVALKFEIVVSQSALRTIVELVSTAVSVTLAGILRGSSVPELNSMVPSPTVSEEFSSPRAFELVTVKRPSLDVIESSICDSPESTR